MPDISIRPADHRDAERLTELVMRAKASWGYDAAFMELCRAELTMTPEKLATWTVWVAERGGHMVGMAALSFRASSAELEEFMVDPDSQRQGVGSALMATVLGECRRLGLARIELDADPHAEEIYLRLGFTTTGSSPSGSIPGRQLPRMVMPIVP
jgi:GNAT superfamily N-acetyltransferase